MLSSSTTPVIPTFEHELGLRRGPRGAMGRLVPRRGHGYDHGHEEAWRDGNRHRRVRAAFLKPAPRESVRDGKLHLATWRHGVLVEPDQESPKRTVSMHVGRP